MTLTDRLHELADAAPDGHRGSAGDRSLWASGKRLQRRRRALAASLVAVLVLALGSLATLVVDTTGQRQLPAADADAVLTLPDRLFLPSPWTAGTDEIGPIGPLVALVGAERRTFWSDAGIQVSGVSTAGDYAFLDLESRATGSAFGPDVTLSPDGRWVAYLLTGSTEGQPNTFDGDPVVGVAAYDTVTGETFRQPVSTDHGLSVDELQWIGDSVVLVYGQYESFDESSSSALGREELRWDVEEGTAEPLSRTTYPALGDATPFGDRVVVTTGRREFTIVSADGKDEPGPRLDVAITREVFVSPDGRWVASNEDPDPTVASDATGPVVVARMTGDQAGEMSRVQRAEVQEGDDTLTMKGVSSTNARVVGWRDDEHLVLAEGAGYVSVEISTGLSEPLVALPPAYGIQPQIAADALRGPAFAAPQLDGPGDPRRMLWLGGAILALLAGAALWRSRVRR